MVVSRLRKNVGKTYYQHYFEGLEHAQLAAPRKYRLNPDFLAWDNWYFRSM